MIFFLLFIQCYHSSGWFCPRNCIAPVLHYKNKQFCVKVNWKKKQPSKFLKPNNYPITQSTNKGAHWNRPNQIDRPKQKMKVQNEIISEHTSFDDNIGKRQSDERKKHTIELEVVSQRARCAQLQLQCKWNAPIQFCVAFFFFFSRFFIWFAAAFFVWNEYYLFEQIIFRCWYVCGHIELCMHVALPF